MDKSSEEQNKFKMVVPEYKENVEMFVFVKHENKSRAVAKSFPTFNSL